MSNLNCNVKHEYTSRHLLVRLVLFLISLAMTISSLIMTQQPYCYGEFGLIAFIPVTFWIGFFLMLTCTILSLRETKIRPGETLIMIMSISGTLSVILPIMSTLPIRSDSYAWMHLVEATLSSGTTSNPNEYMRWPIFWIFGTEFAAISGVDISNLFRFAPTLFYVLAPLFFYLVSRQFLGGIKVSLYASLLFALATAQEHLCPALLGWFLLLFSIYLLARNANKKCWKFVSLFVVVASTLIMEHHLSSLMLAFIATSFVVGKFLSERTRIIRPSLTYPIVLVSFLYTCWIAWMSFADLNFLAMPFQSLLSLGSVMWPSRPITLTGLPSLHVESALAFRGVIYPAALLGFILLIKEKRRLTEIAGWLLTTLIAMLASQLIFRGQFPFETLRFEFFAFFPLLMLTGYSTYYIQARYRGMKSMLIIGILLGGLVLSNQIYRGTYTYTDQFFQQDKSMSTWIDNNAFHPTIIITDYRLESFLSYMSNSNVCNILSNDEIIELFTDIDVSLIMSNLNKLQGLSREYKTNSTYLVVDSIQLNLGSTNQPYSNEAINRFSKVSSLNVIYDNGKIVVYSDNS